MLPKILSQSTNQLVYDSLKKAIISGQLAPGSPLVERNLTEQLGVSRTPVNQAINRLEAENLVFRLPNKRVIVAQISLKDLHHLYTLRACLEVQAVKWAIPRITPAVIELMESNIERMAHYGKAQDHERITQINVAFHRIIHEAGDSLYLSMFMDKIQDATRLFRGQSIYYPGRIEAIIKDHQDITRAIERKDEDAAVRHIMDHVNGALHALVDQYNPTDGAAAHTDVA